MPPKSIDIYAGLNDFTFGDAKPYLSSHSVNSLSPTPDDDPYAGELTPRPSVTEYYSRESMHKSVIQSSVDAHSSDSSSPISSHAGEYMAQLATRRNPSAYRTSDAASHQTYGSSSASASAASLSSGPINSEGTSHTSVQNTDDGDDTGLELSSEDEYDGEILYDDYDDSDEHVIEISSAVYEGSTFSSLEGAVDGWDGFSSRSRSGTSISTGQSTSGVDSLYNERRGSLPMPIPGTEGRDRGDSIATLRRPSRSLENTFGCLNPVASVEGNLTTVASPTSVPESDNDWRNLQAKRFGQGRERGSVSSTEPVNSALSSRFPTFAFTSSPTKPISGVISDFDADWGNLRGGITSFDTSDFVRCEPPRRPSAISARRISLFGRRPSEASSLNAGDTFLNMVGRWDRQGYGVQRKVWTFKREQGDCGIPTRSTGKTSISGSERVILTRVASHNTSGEKERERDKEKRSPVNWRGMPPASSEIWKNEHVGRYSANRILIDSNESTHKGPQHRLVITYIRDTYPKLPHNSPPIIIHKHSKAVAFTISRSYARKPKPDQARETRGLIPPSRDSRGQPIPPPSNQISPGRSGMVLLAPRRVQLAFTSTTTTRKLESHGLLEEKHERKESKRYLDQDHTREKNKKKTNDEIKSNKSRGKKKDAPNQTSSAGSDASNVSSTTSNASSSSKSTSAISSSTSPATSPFVQSFTRPEDTVNARPLRRRRRGSIDIDSSDEDLPRRTPHSETYGALDPSEQIRTLQDRHRRYDSEKAGLLQRMIGNRNSNSVPSHYRIVTYEPPWLLLPSRTKQEEQQRVVENLNASFQDVGLLPASLNRDKSRLKPKRQLVPTTNEVDVFDQVNAESLIMVLPLWPSSTDPSSKRQNPHYLPPEIPAAARQFLLVSYKATETALPIPRTDKSNSKTKDSKKSRSQTSSQESTNKVDDRNILLSAFHISARFFTYNDLQGSGIRLPNDGLPVSGPLDEAFRTRPILNRETHRDWVILGDCVSRESGIVFDPEGLSTLGLCTTSNRPGNLPDDEYPIDLEMELTPVGRAVVEMAWSGGMALTSFGIV